MYFTEVFYEGFSLDKFQMMHIGYLLAFILIVLSVIVSSLGVYFKQDTNVDFCFVNKKQNLIYKITGTSAKAITHVLFFAFALTLVATPILLNNSSAISSALNAETFIKIEYEGEGEGKEYFPTTHRSVTEMKSYTANVIQEVAESGIVLLENKNDVLPLTKNTKVSLFSVSSVDLVYSGAGSSSNKSSCVNLKDGLTSAGLTINEELWNWYLDNYDTYKRTFTGDEFNKVFTLNDASWNNISTSSKSNGDNGAALLVISRNAGEGVDLKFAGGDVTDLSNGNYLELSPNELDILRNLKNEKQAGHYSSIIVLINSANGIQCDFMDIADYGVDALLWGGFFGATGANALGKILVGDVNPSGKNSDLAWKKHMYNPVLANYGAYEYGMRVAPEGNYYDNSNRYCVYQEGIYNGYRYTETRYEDYVLGRTNVGTFNYSDVVSYPFGYGKSYTEFTYSDFSLTKNEGTNVTYTARVRVTNSGAVAGREAAELYIQKPYTNYDVTNHIEKASVELVGYKKSRLLNPGDYEDIEIVINERDLTSYDSYNKKTYILDEGDYYFTFASDSHTAINNILNKKGLNGEQSSRLVGTGNGALADKVSLEFNDSKYSVDDVTNTQITNQFDNADLNIYENASNQVTYVSRNNWDNTLKFGVDGSNQIQNNQVVLDGNNQMKADMVNTDIETDNIAYPTYGSTKTMYSLVDLADPAIGYEDEMWNDLLDQLTWDETVELLEDAQRHTEAISSVGKPGTVDHNGAVGPVKPYNTGSNGYAVRNNDPKKNDSPNVYVCNGLVASTFDNELANRYGKAMGEDCLWAGYNGLYGVGVNLHRSAFGGREFEYYSEDPVLSGDIAGYQVAGVQSFGVYCYMKHAIMNDMESHREGICIWANEQTIRELYLKPFEIAIKEHGAYNIMSGFNRLGLKWNGCQGFINTCLKGEFGMKGFAVSDWCDARTPYMTPQGAVLNGNDIPDGTSYPNGQTFNNYRTGYGALANAMRESAHRILYVVAHSNAMNGLASNVDIIPIVPTWLRTYKKAVRAVNGLFYGFAIFTSLVALSYVSLFILEKKNIFSLDNVFKKKG